MSYRALGTKCPFVNIMAHAAFKAAKNLLRDFGEVENLAISRKGAKDFVSVADQRAEKIIRQTLQKAFPDFGLLLEEGGHIEGTQDMTFVVDPLDGTLNFLHGLPHFCLSIGLLKKETPIAGVIFDPIRDEVFWASAGKGAFMNKRRLRVRGPSPQGLQILGLSHTRSVAYEDKKTAALFTTRVSGSAALDLAYVAAGRLDGFWGYGLAPWDMAAGLCLVTEARGLSKTLSSSPQKEGIALDTQTKTHLLAASPDFFPHLEKAYHAIRS